MAESEVLDRVKFDFRIPEAVRDEFKSRCGFERVDREGVLVRVGMGEVLERLLREYLLTPVGTLKPFDRDDSSPLVGFAVNIDRVVRNQFKGRCGIEEETMARLTTRILQEYLSTTK